MRKIYPIIFKNKISAIQKVSSSAKDGYDNIVKFILKDDFLWETMNTYDAFDELIQTPIDYDIFPMKNDYVKRFLTENLFNNNTIYHDNKFTNNNISIFIDISSVKRMPLIFSLFMHISSSLSKDRVKCRYIVLINDLQTTYDFSLTFFEDYIKSNQLIVIDLQGKLANKDYEKHDEYNNFCLQLSNFNLPLETLIEKKMVTKKGHFKRTDSATKNICFRTYLDGQFCKNEITEYIINFITENFNKRPYCIIYYSKDSPWLDEIIYVLSANKSKKGHININALEEGAIDNDILSNLNCNSEILFVTDLLNSGRTFQKHYSIINDFLKKHNSNSCKIHYFSVLNNKNANSSSRNRSSRKIEISGKPINVHYILDVDVVESLEDNCVLCKLGIPTSKFDEDYRDKLTSFEFWELCHSANYGSETHGPKSRRKIKNYYPIIVKWIENNGPFLAYKFQLLLKSNNISLNDISIVLPDESNNLDESFYDTPSGRFVQCLNLIFDIEYFTIPRNDIDYWHNKNVQMDKLNPNLFWKNQIEGTTKKIIIVDESHVKGGTFDSLYNLLSCLHRPPIAYFPLVDFNPEKTKKNRGKYNIDFLNLYEFQM